MEILLSLDAVRMKGLEPPCLSALDPKSSASTSFATSALFSFLHLKLQLTWVHKKYLCKLHTRIIAKLTVCSMDNSRSGHDFLLAHCATLRQLVTSSVCKADLIKFQRALNFFLEVAQGKETRIEGSPFASALVIAEILIEKVEKPIDAICCVLLRHAINDVSITEAEKMFGLQVVRKIHRWERFISFITSNMRRDSAYFEDLIQFLLQDPEIAILVLAEGMYKLRRLSSFSPKEQAFIQTYTQYLHIPLAGRMSVQNIKSDLEDRYFERNNPAIYRFIKAHFPHLTWVNNRFFKRFTRPIEAKLDQHAMIYTIKSRIKSIASIKRKVKTMGLPLSHVYDVFAVRFILEVSASQAKLACWQVYHIVTSIYKPHERRFRDWLSYPKRNGYQALHVTVMSSEGLWVEVQIRTQYMDAIAERGQAAHWRYKMPINASRYVPGAPEDTLKKYRLPIAQQERFTDVAMQYVSEIYVFTNDHQLVKLRSGATLLDLAFLLDIEMGLKCRLGKINHRFVSCTTTLCHGDYVHIITAHVPQVTKSWLESVATSRAYQAINNFLKQ